MGDHTPDGLSSDLTNASLTSKQIEEEAFEKDFNVFIKYLTPEDWTTIYTCIDILLEHGTNSDSESSSSDTLALPEDAKIWSAKQNASNFTWSTTNTSTTEKRTQKDVNQTQMLEEVFSSSQYIIGKKRRALAELLGLTEKQVSDWFKDRRRRMKQEQSDTNENIEFDLANLIRRQPRHVGAHLAVKQESFDAGYMCTSNLSTEGDVAEQIYSALPSLKSENACPNKNTESNGFL